MRKYHRLLINYMSRVRILPGAFLSFRGSNPSRDVCPRGERDIMQPSEGCVSGSIPDEDV